MRFKYVLLGLVALASPHISNGVVCSNGLPGVEANGVCCEAQCGECGGPGCGGRPGGPTSCCTSNIMDSYVLCSIAMEAPCVIDPGVVCSNGLPGVEANGVCCEAQCGECGGAGCSSRPGGRTSCCTSNIMDSEVMCDTSMKAPCIIDTGVFCSNGLPGLEANGVCCEAQCGECGGPGCGSRPGGPTSCCTQVITGSEVLCGNEMDAPCIIDPGVFCSNGLPGVNNDDICCEAQCGECGGPGCGGRPGGPSSCCNSNIRDSDVMCSTSMEAPCIIDPELFCSYILHGVESNGICCEAQCGDCGGPGCAGRPGGPSACCRGRIEDSGIVCGDNQKAPCILAV